jgi:hypothetical protein
VDFDSDEAASSDRICKDHMGRQTIRGSLVICRKYTIVAVVFENCGNVTFFVIDRWNGSILVVPKIVLSFYNTSEITRNRLPTLSVAANGCELLLSIRSS